MKAILAIIIATLSLGTAQAVEYVTLTTANRNRTLNPTDLVEIVGLTEPRNSINLYLQFEGLDQEVLATLGGFVQSNGVSWINALGNKYTGLLSASYRDNERKGITLKITSASEINAVTPSAVLVLPENSTGNFDVVIEASDDLISWLPFFSQTVNSQTAKKFFRTRVVRSEAPVQKP